MNDNPRNNWKTIQFSEWLINRGKAENTIKTYEKAVAYFDNWYLSTFNEGVNYKKVRPADIREWKNYLIKEQKKKDGQPLSIRTINNYLESIKTFFRYLISIGEIDVNPTESIKPQKVNMEYTPRWLDKNEQRELIRAIENPILKSKNPWLYSRNHVIIYLSLHAGLRISEIVALTIDDFKNGYIQIRDGKGHSAREVPINKSLAKSIAEWLEEREKKEPQSNHFLISQKKNPLTESGIYNLFNRLSKETRIEELSPHTLRHTFAHNLIEKGEPINHVAHLLGHSDLETTRIYISPKKKNLEEAVNKLSDEY